jgi:hypothetical protein
MASLSFADFPEDVQVEIVSYLTLPTIFQFVVASNVNKRTFFSLQKIIFRYFHSFRNFSNPPKPSLSKGDIPPISQHTHLFKLCHVHKYFSREHINLFL